MAYNIALEKSWQALLKQGNFNAVESAAGVCYDANTQSFSVKFFSDIYTVSLPKQEILVKQKPANDFNSILILHYLAGVKIIPQGYNWITFNQLESGQFYYPAFYERAIRPLIDEFSTEKKKLSKVLDVLDGEVLAMGDAAVRINVFAKFSIGVVVWYGDEELPGNANILFDKNSASFFSTEDLAVLGGITAGKLIKCARQ